jgi:large subunit ribosomal protein L3
MINTIIGTKIGMTQLFDDEGKVHAVTMVKTGPLTVIDIKTMERDGYKALVLGYGIRKEKNINKAQKGVFGDMGNFSHVFELTSGEFSGITKGTVINAEEVLNVKDAITVAGVSKSKGFQGVVKRHGFKGGRRSHGQKHSEREPGSIGVGGIQRVFKGTRMGGRMGGERISVRGLVVLGFDKKEGTIFVKGAVPGRRDTLLEITHA